MKQFHQRAQAYIKDEESLTRKHLVVRVPQISLSDKFPRRTLGRLGVLLLKWSKSRIISVVADIARKEPDNKQ